MKILIIVLCILVLTCTADTWAVEPSRAVPAAYQQSAMEAKESLARGDYQAAEEEYESLLIALPENLLVLGDLAAAQFGLGKLDLAKGTLERTIAIYPEDAYSYHLLGIIYFRKKQYDAAVKMLERAIALDPKSASAHKYLSLVYSQQKQAQRAEEEYQKACELDPYYLSQPTL